MALTNRIEPAYVRDRPGHPPGRGDLGGFQPGRGAALVLADDDKSHPRRSRP